MRFLTDLITIFEAGEDLSKLPKDIISAIKKNIRKGAEDINQKWGNALELVHKAYEIEGVERPDPTLKSAWEQYETMLQYAVEQLADNRGMDADWRMSSAMFHESLQPRQKYEVSIRRINHTETYITEAKSIQEIVDRCTDVTIDTQVELHEDSAGIKYTQWGIQKPIRVSIKKV